MTRRLKLLPRLVPKPIWWKNLRTHLGQTKWLSEVSRPVRESAGQGCELCGGTGEGAPRWKLCCDEVWEYDDAKRTATLVDLQSICWKCSGIIHLGNTTLTMPERLPELEVHTRRVNGISAAIWKKAVAEEFETWRWRSSLKGWKVQWRGWRDVLEKTFERHNARLGLRKVGARERGKRVESL